MNWNSDATPHKPVGPWLSPCLYFFRSHLLPLKVVEHSWLLCGYKLADGHSTPPQPAAGSWDQSTSQLRFEASRSWHLGNGPQNRHSKSLSIPPPSPTAATLNQRQPKHLLRAQHLRGCPLTCKWGSLCPPGCGSG